MMNLPPLSEERSEELRLKGLFIIGIQDGKRHADPRDKHPEYIRGYALGLTIEPIEPHRKDSKQLQLFD